MKSRYIGCRVWFYRLGSQNSNRPADGAIEILVPTGNYQQDEYFARHLLREKLKLKRLPAKTTLWPQHGRKQQWLA